MTDPLPLTVITGYLGAGKTTLLNAILARPLGQTITVLVNDFGEIAIDESLIINKTGDTIALTNGCVCCTIGGDLYDAIDKILTSEPRPDRLIIETSGVADPSKILQIAMAEPDLRADRCATLIDCVNFTYSLCDPFLADSLLRQIQAADLLILTKTDLVPPDQVADLVDQLAVTAPGIPIHVSSAALRTETLFGLRNRPELAHKHHHDHGTEYATWSYQGPARLDPETLNTASTMNASGCLRLKGHVTTKDGETFAVQRAGAQWQCNPIPPRTDSQVVAIGTAQSFQPAKLAALIS